MAVEEKPNHVMTPELDEECFLALIAYAENPQSSSAHEAIVAKARQRAARIRRLA